jgi:hypothetical protein
MSDKATSEQGRRLNIRKATLRLWRSEFARHLRELGVPANATERAVRGVVRTTRKDGIYRARLRGESTYMRERTQLVAHILSRDISEVESGKAKLVETRNNVQCAWGTISEILIRDNCQELAAEVKRFAERMPPAVTEREWMAGAMIERNWPPRAREGPTR